MAAIEADGGRAIAVQADVASEPDVIRLFETVDRELGGLDALVNNAAILMPQSRLDEMDIDRLERMFAVNITGAFLCARDIHN